MCTLLVKTQTIHTGGLQWQLNVIIYGNLLIYYWDRYWGRGGGGGLGSIVDTMASAWTNTLKCIHKPLSNIIDIWLYSFNISNCVQLSKFVMGMMSIFLFFYIGLVMTSHYGHEHRYLFFAWTISWIVI